MPGTHIMPERFNLKQFFLEAAYGAGTAHATVSAAGGSNLLPVPDHMVTKVTVFHGIRLAAVAAFVVFNETMLAVGLA
jgi:hypothetical protein